MSQLPAIDSYVEYISELDDKLNQIFYEDRFDKRSDEFKKLVKNKKLEVGQLAQALYVATDLGNYDIVKFLLENSVNPNTTFSYDKEPVLYLAVTKCDLSIIALLIFYGADVDCYSDYRPILAAIQYDYLTIVRGLIANKCSIFPGGIYILSHAVEYLRYDIVRYLMSIKFDINMYTQLSKRPLTVAVETRDIKMVELVLSFKPDIQAGNSEALNLAKTKGYKEMETLLQ
jgi:ankyrin repeat protein